MEPTPFNPEFLTVNLLTIAGAVVALIVAFSIVGWIVRRLLRLITAAPALHMLEAGAKILGKSLGLILVIVCAIGCLALIAGGAYLMYGGENLPEYLRTQVLEVPVEFWIDLAIAAAKVVGLVILTAIVLSPVRRLLRFLCARAKAYEGIKANDESIEQFFGEFRKIVSRAAWLYVLVLSVRILALPEIVYEYAFALLMIYLIVAAGILLRRGMDAIIASLDALSEKYSRRKDLLRYYDHLQHLVPVLRRAIEFVIWVVVASLVVLQVEPLATLAGWGPRLIRIIGILFLSRVVIEVANLLVEEILVTRADLAPEQKQRRKTITPLFKSILKYVIYFIAVVLVCKELGQDPAPILAGAGILGLAVGLASKDLIADVLAGFFILFENYFLVGDFVRIGEAEGTVEVIDLRATHVRDNSGRLHIVRNGQIQDLVNYSKEYTFAAVEVGVAYDSDLDHVFAVLERVGHEVHAAEDDVLEPALVQGLENFGESELTIRTKMRVKPGRHLQMQRVIRKRIKEAFDEAEIEIPFARRVIIFDNPLESAGAGEDAGEPAPVV